MLTTPRKIGLNTKSKKKVTLVVKDLPVNAGDRKDAGSIPGLGRSSGVGNGNPLQYSCLENSVDRGAWWATVHGVAESSCSAASFIPLIVSLCISFSPLFHLLSSLPLSPFLPSFLFYLPSLFKPFNSCVVIMFCALNFHFWSPQKTFTSNPF